VYSETYYSKLHVIYCIACTLLYLYILVFLLHSSLILLFSHRLVLHKLHPTHHRYHRSLQCTSYPKYHFMIWLWWYMMFYDVIMMIYDVFYIKWYHTKALKTLIPQHPNCLPNLLPSPSTGTFVLAKLHIYVFNLL